MKNRYLRRLNNQRGSILLMVLVSVSIVGLLAGIAGSSWQTFMQRSKETDLLWKGDQIRRAIGYYYEFKGTGATEIGKAKTGKKKAFPKNLEDLLKDPRVLTTTRHLRKLFPDPMTGNDWELISSPDGGIMGVRSESDKAPFKQAGFSDTNKNFIGKKSYHEWQFVYAPVSSTKSNQVSPVKK